MLLTEANELWTKEISAVGFWFITKHFGELSLLQHSHCHLLGITATLSVVRTIHTRPSSIALTFLGT